MAKRMRIIDEEPRTALLILSICSLSSKATSGCLSLDPELKRGRNAGLIAICQRPQGNRAAHGHLVSGIDNSRDVIREKLPLALEVVAVLKPGPGPLAEVADARADGVGIVQEGAYVDGNVAGTSRS